MKGQVTFAMKPIVLVLTVVLLLMLIYSINSFKVKERRAQKALDITSSATSILLLMANSEDCLAFRVPITKGAYANVVDARKLDEFMQIYNNREPDCARSYDFGWRMEIVEFENDFGKGIERNRWSFGAKEFSQDVALNEKVEFWMPVAIRHSQRDVKVGRMELTVVDGELERISGFLDWSCRMGMFGKLSSTFGEFKITYPITYDNTNNYLCSEGIEKSCRELICVLERFEDMESPGTYSISMIFESPNKLLVRI